MNALLTFESLQGARPTETVREVYRRVRECTQPVWIALVPEEEAFARAEALEREAAGPRTTFYGLPFAVKDNIDVAGMPTTAGCPAFAYIPSKNAAVVDVFLALGAILIGKTNMDQFATGLVGMRSPYGACSSVFNERYVSGGSSSGSAVAVAAGLVSFALGTDTAGSGRVPAAFNNIVGWKPTRGLVSTEGVVPACRTLDCVSFFTANPVDALHLQGVVNTFAAKDPFARKGPVAGRSAAAAWASGAFRFGVPSGEQLEFFGDVEAAQLFQEAEARLVAAGGTRVEIDFTPFRAAAALLYAGPWVAERVAALQGFFPEREAEMDPTVATILRGASQYSAVDAFLGMYQLAAIQRETERQWERMDVLLLPTTGTIYTKEQVRAEPILLNSNLGYYTNFVNLLDLAAIAIPAGFRPNGLPFGVSLIGRTWTDQAVIALAARMRGEDTLASAAPGCVMLAVVGAHLTGQPLNRQLTEREARLVQTCRTAKGYRLYALQGTVPAKPGLVREPGFDGPGIEVEVWAVPEDRFGGFVNEVPPPLSIGTAELEDGSTVKCFLCEPYVVAGAEEITALGGWRRYLLR